MLQSDNIVAPGADGLAELGIAPASLASIAEGWLVQYRRHGRFAEIAAQ
jgi:NADH dehydrogenase